MSSIGIPLQFAVHGFDMHLTRPIRYLARKIITFTLCLFINISQMTFSPFYRHHGVCRHLTPDGCRVNILRIAHCDLDFNLNYEPYYATKRHLMLIDMRMHEEYLFSGECIVYDMAYFSTSHLSMLFTPIMLKRLFVATVSVIIIIIIFHFLDS